MNHDDEERFEHEASGGWVICVAYTHKRSKVEAMYPNINWKRRYSTKADCLKAIKGREGLSCAYELSIAI